jgi:hypothetical protein
MFMQSIVGRKWASYSARLSFAAIPDELRPAAPKGAKRRQPANPSLLELTTFHLNRS